MKKKNLLCISALSLLALALPACSNDDDVLNGAEVPEVATGEQVIVLDMQDTDVLSTKSRPLYSTENKGAENVTDVKLMIFEHQVGTQMKLSQVISIPNWNQISSEYNYGNKLTIKLGTDYGSQKLEKDKTYTIYAVGQDETIQTPAPFTVNSSNTIVNLAIGTGLTEGLTWNGNTAVGEGFVKTDAVSYSDESAFKSQAVSEIYSGISQPVEIKLDGGFSASVLLKRQVAGVLGYFNRIPAWVKNTGDNGHKSVRYIRLVASNRNTNVDLTNKMGVQTDDATGSSDVEYVVNGFTAEGASNSKDAKYKSATGDNDAYTIYEIDLSKWFTNNLGDTKAEGKEFWGNNDETQQFSFDKDWATSYETDVPMLGINTSAWYNPYNPANTGKGSVIVEENSVLAGEFVIPFEKNPQSKTFELQLLDSTKTEVLKAWDVNLDEMSRTDADQEKFYNIYRNHLYQIGQRGSGDDPTNPGTDPDKPQPLDKDQELTIKINDQWEFIHDMEIE